jgi:alkylated DNA repair protein (DNA oxidative demethylase)
MVVQKIRGFAVHSEFLSRPAQEGLIEAVREIARAAPMMSPMTPYGKPMRVKMTSAGAFGWTSSAAGYCYAPVQPSGAPWPAIPKEALAIWSAVSGTDRAPECCLVNYYGEDARMGLHQDRDEANFEHPVVSVSLGDTGLFRIGNTSKGGPTESIWLSSGDVVVMGGAARLTDHGVDRIRCGSSTLLPKGGRLNLTMRVVT